ncbi:hypothetical protein ACFST9_03085 [Hymenobacter monticola]
MALFPLSGAARPLLQSLAALALGGCMALPTTNKRANEKLELKVIERPRPLDIAAALGHQRQDAGLMASRGTSRGLFVLVPLLAKALPMAADGVKQLIKQEEKKYTAEYQFGKSNLYFYDAPSESGVLDPHSIKLQGFELTRTARTGSSDNLALRLRLDMRDDEASLFNLLNNSVFQLKVADLELHYAKAKVPAAHWYMPWTLMYRQNDKVNLDVAVKLAGSWIGDDGTMHTNQVLGTAMLTLRDVPINNPEALRAYEQQQKDKTLEGYFYLVPRSAGSYLSAPTAQSDGIRKGYGQGIYSVAVTVVESGKTHFVNKAIIDNINVLDQAPAAILKTMK